MKPLLIACDFDGTITRRDTLHVLVEQHGEHGLWEDLEPRLRAGEITVEQAMEIEFAAVRATPDEVRESVRALAPIRDGFAAWVAASERAGHRIVVISNGFRSIIEPVLRDAGAGHLPVVAHDARFSAAGCEILWSERGPRCDLCGRPCKRHPLHAVRGGEPLVYIGDGISDRCVCLQADVIFARDGLAEYLTERGVTYLPFDDFGDVTAGLSDAFAVTA